MKYFCHILLLALALSACTEVQESVTIESEEDFAGRRLGTLTGTIRSEGNRLICEAQSMDCPEGTLTLCPAAPDDEEDTEETEIMEDTE